MSRIAESPIELPSGVAAELAPGDVVVKGPKGSLRLALTGEVNIERTDTGLTFAAANGDRRCRAMAGTVRALVNNMVIGVSQGFERRLQLVGVGYRAQAKGGTLTLQLGFSHPIEYRLPEGVEAETPTQTEVVLRGLDKQRVGQAAAEIRSFRPPEPYKGKGVRYAGEWVRRKEAKKK